jgi:3-phenylpropionate/trans-cinnamate dioxygenase ferredoxin reductase component
VAAGLRDEGYDGRITILGNEPAVPFGRPPLSKTYLRGEEDLSSWLVKPPVWYHEADVVLRPSSPARRIDTANRCVVIEDGTEVRADAVVIATGARARRPPLPGIDLDGVFPLRTQSDADAISARALGGAKTVVVGMSFIGAEVAASLRQLGAELTAVFPGAGPLAGVLGDPVAARIAEIHRANGVELMPEEKVASFRGGAAVEEVVTESGRVVECSMVVVGLGVDPNVEVARSSGIGVEDGIVVDSSCRSTIEEVYAAGDVAAHDHPLFGRVRVEHYNNAEMQGRHVARSMLGRREPYDYVHSFWSDQYDHKIEYVGHARTWDDFVVRGDISGAFIGFYLSNGVVRAAMGLDRGGDPEAEPEGEMAACAELVRRRSRVEVRLLADDDTDLRSLG